MRHSEQVWEGLGCGRGTVPLLLVLIAAIFVVSGCRPGEQPDRRSVHYVVTLPVLGLILTPVVKGRADVSVLLADGGSPHVYEPTPGDVRRVTGSAALFRVGRSLDGWTTNLPVEPQVSLLELVPDSLQRSVYSERCLPRRTRVGTDPHFWTDPVAVRQLLLPLADTLCTLDPAGCERYRTNANDVSQTLQTVHKQVRSELRVEGGTEYVLSKPFFQYFLGRYDVRVRCIVEPPPGGEPSPRDIQYLIDTVRQYGVQAVLAPRSLPAQAGRVVAETAGIPFIRLDAIGTQHASGTYRQLLLDYVHRLNRSFP